MSATMAKHGGGLWIRVARGVLALMVVAAGGLAVWYRQAYHVWPGEGASARVHWCGRDYQAGAGRPQTWRQITSTAPLPVRAVGWYPPLGFSRQELFAPAIPEAERLSASPPPVCAMVVYLRTGPDEYQAFGLVGGPVSRDGPRPLWFLRGRGPAEIAELARRCWAQANRRPRRQSSAVSNAGRP